MTLDYRWIGRYSKKRVYLHYAIPDFEHVTVYLERLFATQSMWLIISDATLAVTPGSEVPGFADRTFEAAMATKD